MLKHVSGRFLRRTPSPSRSAEERRASAAKREREGDMAAEAAVASDGLNGASADGQERSKVRSKRKGGSSKGGGLVARVRSPADASSYDRKPHEPLAVASLRPPTFMGPPWGAPFGARAEPPSALPPPAC